MNDLITFKNAQIAQLQSRVSELEIDNIQLSTWIFEVCDEDCPKEYREQVLIESNKLF
jgi:hypothetical protein